MKNQIFVLFFLILITSCVKKEVDGGNNKNGTFTRMNIENVNTLFIASSNQGSKMYGFKESSLKGTSSEKDEEIFEIRYLDENGKPVEKNNPDFVYDIGDFIYVLFLDELDGSTAYFVKKTDGLIYQIPLVNSPPARSGSYEQKNKLFSFFGLIQLDEKRNVYYPCHSSALYKVSSIASSEIQFNEVSVENDITTGFCVDNEGQIIYAYRPDNATLESARYRKQDGTFVDMTIDDYDTGKIRCFWKGTNGCLYGFMQTPVDGGVCFVKIQEGQIVKIRDVNHDILLYGFDKFSKNTFEVQGRIIYCIRSSSNTNNWHLIDISNESSYKETLCSVQPNMVVKNQLCYFDDQTFSCTIINIDTGETSLLFDLDESQLSNFAIDKIISVTESGVVFSCMQLSDGKNFIVKIGLDNSVTVQQVIEGKISIITPLTTP